MTKIIREEQMLLGTVPCVNGRWKGGLPLPKDKMIRPILSITYDNNDGMMYPCSDMYIYLDTKKEWTPVTASGIFKKVGEVNK